MVMRGLNLGKREVNRVEARVYSNKALLQYSLTKSI